MQVTSGARVNKKARVTIGTTVIAAVLSLIAYLGISPAAAAQSPSHDLFVQIFSTIGSDKHWFWSGRLNNVSVEGKAAEKARAAGGYTLETRLVEQDVTMPTFDMRDPASTATWEDASRTYAEQASGTVHFLQGDPRPGSVWEVIEFPTLKKNNKVTMIIRVDAKSNTESIIWPEPGPKPTTPPGPGPGPTSRPR
jgi:hypothetical protein